MAKIVINGLNKAGGTAHEGPEEQEPQPETRKEIKTKTSRISCPRCSHPILQTNSSILICEGCGYRGSGDIALDDKKRYESLARYGSNTPNSPGNHVYSGDIGFLPRG